MKRKTILIVLFVAVITLSITTFTYAYFQGGVNNENQQTATITAGTMNLTFADNDNGIGAVMNFGDTITKKFTIENTGTVTSYARISWLNMINTYLEGSLVYTLEYSDTEDGVYRKMITEKNIPRSEVTSTITLADGVSVPANTKRYYNLHITLVYSETVDQTADLNAMFNTLFTIESTRSASSTTLAALGLENSVKSEPTEYNMFNYTFTPLAVDFKTFSTKKMDGICTFNGNTVNSARLTIPNKIHCNKIYDVTPLGYYDASIEEYNLGEGDWNEEEGTCTYNGNPVLNLQNLDDYTVTTKEDCNNVHLFMMQYNGTLEQAFLTGITEVGTGTWNNVKTTDGIYSTEDDFGISYYFRGGTNLNNIVKFGKYDTDMYYYSIEISDKGYEIYSTGDLEDCRNESLDVSVYCTNEYKYANMNDDIYWRIVRINGDGTLRLLYLGADLTIQKNIGLTYFNSSSNDIKYVGYTYDNSAPNVQDGTDSDVKKYLETWYSKVLQNEDKYIATAQFFNDTTNDGSYFSSYLRNNFALSLGNIHPTLKTTLTTETYGGTYNLKVGLINVDELTFSGHDGVQGVSYLISDKSVYPFSIANMGIMYDYLTMSPAKMESSAEIFIIDIMDNGGALWEKDTTLISTVAPVINLTSETAQQLIGSGSTIDPYRLN